MKFDILCLLYVNFYISLSVTLYRDTYYTYVLGTIGVNANQCVYVGDLINDAASSVRWSDAANFNRCICFHDNYPCSGRTRCWDEGNRFVENFDHHSINDMISAISLYDDPNTPCYSRNRY